MGMALGDLTDNVRRGSATVRGLVRGHRFGAQFEAAEKERTDESWGVADAATPLEEYFDNHVEGHGIWKWRHYFSVYDRHLERFRNQEVHVVEIGVFSGGSLEMWREYFGAECHVYGVDIEEACRAYENEWTQIFIGDQADPAFWEAFRRVVPRVDVVIDDGGHQPHQQIATLEALLPELTPGGVYICEDVHGTFNGFQGYLNGLGHALNSSSSRTATGLQRAVEGIHSYPYITVIERNRDDVIALSDGRHGTLWQRVFEGVEFDPVTFGRDGARERAGQYRRRGWHYGPGRDAEPGR